MDARQFIDGVARDVAALPTKPTVEAVKFILSVHLEKVGLGALTEDVMDEVGLCRGGVEISSLHDKPCPKCGAADDDECQYVAPITP